MSFFNDFLDYFSIDDMTNKTCITTILGVGVVIVGKIKIENLSEERIELFSGKDKIVINGIDLKIKSVSKGELIVSGNVKNVGSGEDLWRKKFVLKFQEWIWLES